MYRTELEMSEKFEKFLKKEFGNSYLKEVSGLFGIPDFVIYDKSGFDSLIISFELKLKNWKKASIQAFRYRSFSNGSYVVMPKTEFNSPEFSYDHFKKYNIGLAEFDIEGNFKIVYKPRKEKPYSEKLNKKFSGYVVKSRKKSKNINSLFA